MDRKKIDSICLISICVELLVILIVLLIFGTDFYKEIHKDKAPPTITVKQNDLTFFDTDDINYLDYVEVTDNSGQYEVNVLNEEEAKIPGERYVNIKATDASGNTSEVFLNLTIISEDEWKEYVSKKTNNYLYRRQENVEFEELKGRVDYDAFHLAEEFVGMGGACNEVAQAFISAYYGEEYNIFDTYSVTKEEAMPGDIIYYENGGLGEQHFAVYLGGASALQGNIYGTTVLGSVYMNYGSEPHFYRLNGK